MRLIVEAPPKYRRHIDIDSRVLSDTFCDRHTGPLNASPISLVGTVGTTLVVFEAILLLFRVHQSTPAA